MGEVVSMVSKSPNAKLWSVSDAILDAHKRIEEGELSPNKVLVIMLTESDGQYKTSYSQAQMSCSEMILLLEIQKQLFLKDMGL